MATKRPGDDTNGHSGNGHAPDAKKTKDVSNINILVKLAILDHRWLPVYSESSLPSFCSSYRSAQAEHCYSLEQLTGKK